MKKVVGYIHPSMAKVTELTEDFLKQAHKIMRDKGYKLDSSAEFTGQWTYEKPGSPTVWMHGRWPSLQTGKVVFGINVDGSDSTFMKSDLDIISFIDFELTSSRAVISASVTSTLQYEKIKQYKENLKKALEFLNDIEAYIVMIAMTS